MWVFFPSFKIKKVKKRNIISEIAVARDKKVNQKDDNDFNSVFESRPIQNIFNIYLHQYNGNCSQ